MVDASDFICCTYMQIHPLYMPMKRYGYMCNSGDIVSGTSVARICKVDVTISNILQHVYANAGCIELYRIMAV